MLAILQNRDMIKNHNLQYLAYVVFYNFKYFLFVWFHSLKHPGGFLKCKVLMLMPQHASCKRQASSSRNLGQCCLRIKARDLAQVGTFEDECVV